MNRSSLLINRTLLRTVIYLTILLIPIAFSLISPDRGGSLTLFGVTFSIATLFTAWVEHVLVLRFLDRRQYVMVILGTAGAFLVFPAVRFLLEQYLTLWLFGSTNYHTASLTVGFYVIDNYSYALTALGFGLVFKLIEDWFRHQQERQALVGEKTTAELAFLKSQINPHFLFNTLNNIYALAYTKSDAAPGAILKLSELMRYMLYDSAGPTPNGASPVANGAAPGKVSLSKEVQYLRNLVDLETLRVPDAQVEFTVEGNTDLYRIEPLLLISFVENAVKHGILTDPAHPLVIHLSVRQGKLLANVVNKKSSHQKDAVGGVGLPNVRRRLDLLYPNQYTLRVNDDEQTYSTRLELTL